MKNTFKNFFHSFFKKIPTMPLKEIINFEKTKINVELMNLTFREGNVSPIELFYISMLIRYFNPEKIFEIGTFDGNTTLQMAINSGNKAKIFTLDIKPEEINTLELPIEEKDRKF